MMASYTVLGIESSCDETAAAVFTTNEGIRSSMLFSQGELHQKFGGVVPEIASRSHLEKINSIVESALNRAEKTFDDIDVVAVTNKPGLPGSLLTGLCFAKGLAWAGNKKIIGVNHLEGHIFSACLENKVPFPHLCLTASGGHTSLYIVHDYGNFTLLGTTRDDAAGEAFDKVSKMMELGYPGGPIIERLAQQAAFHDYFRYPRLKEHDLSFSFSGLKTAVLYDLVKRGAYDLTAKQFLAADNNELKQQVASSLLVCIGDIFQDRLARAHAQHPTLKAVTFVGGVACNKYLKQRLATWAQHQGLSFFSPSPAYCTDNAAMIALVGHYKAQQGKFDDITLDIY